MIRAWLDVDTISGKMGAKKGRVIPVAIGEVVAVVIIIIAIGDGDAEEIGRFGRRVGVRESGDAAYGWEEWTRELEGRVGSSSFGEGFGFLEELQPF